MLYFRMKTVYNIIVAGAGERNYNGKNQCRNKALVDMVKSEELKPSDRLSAIKTILDYAGKQAPPEDTDAELRVVFDGLEEGFAD